MLINQTLQCKCKCNGRWQKFLAAFGFLFTLRWPFKFGEAIPKIPKFLKTIFSILEHSGVAEFFRVHKSVFRVHNSIFLFIFYLSVSNISSNLSIQNNTHLNDSLSPRTIIAMIAMTQILGWRWRWWWCQWWCKWESPWPPWTQGSQCSIFA